LAASSVTASDATPHRPTRVAVVGAGGVGGYFAGALAIAGHQCTSWPRIPPGRNAGQRWSAHRRARGQRRIVDVGATDDPAALVGAEFVIVAVKSYSVAAVAPILRDLAEHGSVIVPSSTGRDR